MVAGVGLGLPAPLSPFWAPLDEVEIGNVMRLGAVDRDAVFLDLGCGDGRVMEAALDRGAIAVGVELDGDLASAAKRRLARFGDRARVVVGSFYTADLAADVVFAYLSPAVLQRLGPRLARLKTGTRIITAWFAVPGWNASTYRGNCHLFETPVERAPSALASGTGWASPGILCFLPSRGRFLVTAELVHRRGPVRVELSPALRGVAEASVGAESVDAPQPVAVDLVFEGRPPGTIVAGMLASPDAGACELFCCYHPDASGYWPLDAAMCQRVRSTSTAGTVSS